MIGNRVRIIIVRESDRQGATEGTLHRLDAAGATVYRTSNVMPEAQGTVFIPMGRIIEIVDLGRAP